MLPKEVLDWCKTYTGPKFHALISDPPYGYHYNQKSWDNEIALQTETWASIHHHLLPGAFAVAYAAPRLYHRLAIAVEDAGFAIHPFLLNWHQMQSMPRATKAAEGHYYGRQVLRNSIEPILLFQKPTKTPKPTFFSTGAGTLNIQAAQINNQWPTNVVVQHAESCNLFGCEPACLVPNNPVTESLLQTNWEAEIWERTDEQPALTTIPKASRFERDVLLEDLPDTECKRVNDGGLSHDPRFAPIQVKNFHPTVKPIALAVWLGKLLLPPDQFQSRLLNPFAGSGTEHIGAWLGGWEEVYSIESDPGYAELAAIRISRWQALAEKHGKEAVCAALSGRNLKSLLSEQTQQMLF
ncbi:MAG: site-specific DNA-methyltransferase [Acidobacteria bacterium]|nr:site-specific DNA-methyltransferase [Acidobacteriota bacterium]